MSSILTNACISLSIFVLALAPGAIGQSLGEPGAGTETILQLVMQGGFGSVLLWIWWKTFKQANDDKKMIRQEIKEVHNESLAESRRIARENAARHRATEEALMELVRQQHESNRALRGVLSRLETKLEQQTS